MPAYQTSGSITALYQGDSGLAWSNENPGLAAKSLQFALVPTIGAGGQHASVEVTYSGNPGAVQVDFQTSDTDIDADYVTKTSLAAVNAAFTGRLELGPPFTAKFCRLVNVAQANLLPFTAKITKG